MKITVKSAIDVNKASYIYQKLTHCIKNNYEELALKYLDELVDVLAEEDES